MPSLDALDVVREHLQAVADGRIARGRGHEIADAVNAVAARMERLKRVSPAAAMTCSLGEEFEALVSSLKGGGRGFFGGMAAVL